MTTTQAVRTEPDLATILRTYNEVTERLKRSHEALLTEVARLHDELHEKNRELQRRERLAALGEMAAGLAHEIRNPLGGIGLYASVLEKDLADRPRERDVARRISAGVGNLERIVRDILAFAGDADPKLADVRLDGVLDAVLGHAAPAARARMVNLAVDSDLGELTVRCDAGQIERALLNLVLNAIDAVDDGGHVRVRASRRPNELGSVAIVVEDDGAGIAAEHLHRIFNPFFTTKDHGTGLGLAIVHRIAEAHGGSITARNRSEGGASFVLSLPLGRARSNGRKPRNTRGVEIVRGFAPAAKE